MTTDIAVHLCQCPACAPEVFPHGPRLSEAHTASRFDDPIHHLRASLDGREISEWCHEALAGRDGFAVCYQADASGRKHICQRCFREICQAVKRGEVSVWTAP
jgi:hypothetical protein